MGWVLPLHHPLHHSDHSWGSHGQVFRNHAFLIVGESKPMKSCFGIYLNMHSFVVLCFGVARLSVLNEFLRYIYHYPIMVTSLLWDWGTHIWFSQWPWSILPMTLKYGCHWSVPGTYNFMNSWLYQTLTKHAAVCMSLWLAICWLTWDWELQVLQLWIWINCRSSCSVWNFGMAPLTQGSFCLCAQPMRNDLTM